MSEVAFVAPAATNEPSPEVATATSVATTKVLHIVNGEHYSGAERVQDLLAGYLPAFGYGVSFACLKPGLFAQRRTFQQAPLIDMPMRSKWDRSVAEVLTRWVEQEGHQIIHAHTPRSLWIAGRVAAKTAVPLVYHVHSPAGRDSTRPLANAVNAWLERRVARGAARLIAVAPGVRRYMLERGFADSRVIYIPNGVPTIPVSPRTTLPTSWALGMFALFRPRKGIETLLEALAQLRSDGFDVCLRVVGPFETPAYEAEIRRLAARLQLDEAITWTGFVDEVAREMEQVDVSVLPSLFGEGLPMVVLESMAAGVPVVASRVDGPPTAIDDRREGLLVPPGDPDALAASLGALIRGQHDYVAMSQAAQRRHRLEFSAEAMAAGVAEVYASLLK